MELSISRSSLGLPAIIPQNCKATSIDNRVFSIKPTTKNIKSSNFPSKSSTNKFILPLGFYGQNRFSKSLLYGQNRGNTLQVHARTQSGESDGTLAKVTRFGSSFFKFIRPYAMVYTISSSTCFFARVLVENPKLFKWSLILKAFPGLIAMMLADAYFTGLNEIFDVDIDSVNKPYLPIPSGKISIKQAWFVVISYILGGLLILRLLNVDFVTTSFYCFGLFLATFYSAPPLRFKQSPITTSISNPLMAGVVQTLGLLYASKASLGLPFVWSPPIVFITVFATTFFLVIANIKDLTDVEGDIQHNIRTFPAIYGPRKTTFFFVGILLANYIGATVAGICMSQAFKPFIMVPAHAILGLLLFFKARKLDKSNYSKVRNMWLLLIKYIILLSNELLILIIRSIFSCMREASANFFRFLWKILSLECLLFPFI